MNSFEVDKNILRIIRYGAVLPIIIFSFTITFIFINQKNYELNKEIESIKTKFLEENKKTVKSEVQRVVNSLNYEIKNSEYKLKQFLKEKVYEAYNIANNIYLKESSYEENGYKHSKEYIFNIVKHALGGMIYNQGRGYIFLDDINGVKVLQPFNKSFEGKNFLEYEDAKGYKFVKKIVETIKNKSESYDTYYWYKSKEDKTPYKKMSFYKYFEPFNIAIGTGEYLIDFENELKKELLEKIRNIKFLDNGYIFIFDNKGKYLSHFDKKNIGKNGFEVKDSKGNYFIKDLTNFAKENKEGYYSYYASSNPNKMGTDTKKISFVKHFEKWNWTIGAGFYLEELTKNIEKKEKELKESYQDTINSILILSLILTISLLILSYSVSNIVARKFKNYKNSIKKEVQKTIEKDKLLVQQSKLATMGEMIGNISHQWRQPLSAISTASTGVKLQHEMQILKSEDLYNSMDLINDSTQYLSQTIEDFRNFFNPNKTKEDFCINSVFEKVSKLLSSRFKEHGIEIIKDIDNFEINENENELLQVIINILKNARDELIQKDKKLKKMIFITTKKDDDKFIIEIKDNAGGIEKDIIEKIFNPYFTTKNSSNGTGIGLYMSKQIIEKMDGKLSVQNIKLSYHGGVLEILCQSDRIYNSKGLDNESNT